MRNWNLSTVSGRIIVQTALSRGDFMTNDRDKRGHHRQKDPDPKRHISTIILPGTVPAEM